MCIRDSCKESQDRSPDCSQCAGIPLRSSAAVICGQRGVYAARRIVYHGNESGAQAAYMGQFQAGPGKNTAGAVCVQLLYHSRADYSGTDYFLFFGCIFLLLPGV